jgi:hypothetical protein
MDGRWCRRGGRESSAEEKSDREGVTWVRTLMEKITCGEGDSLFPTRFVNICGYQILSVSVPVSTDSYLNPYPTDFLPTHEHMNNKYTLPSLLLDHYDARPILCRHQRTCLEGTCIFILVRQD